jgi:hypothetical protein
MNAFFTWLTSWMKPSNPDPSKVVGDGTWPWFAMINGDDLVLNTVKATAFGGDNDRMDNGRTASGYNTKGHPNLIACSLPMRHDTLFDHERGQYVLRGSPIPSMPFGLYPDGTDNPHGAHVDIIFPDKRVVFNVPVIDLGPAKWTGNAIDLSIALARKYDPRATANNFEAKVDVRIKGAVRFLG